MSRITPLRILMEWRRYARIIYEAVKATIPEAEVYLIGGAAENRLTVMSDVDILVVIPSKPSFQQAVELREKKSWRKPSSRACHSTLQ